jgi:hypothetical protein
LKEKLSVGGSLATEIDFAASHFHELDATDLKGLDLSVLEQLVSSDSLRLNSEDSLLSFISGLEFESQIVLLRYLRSEYLSPDAVENPLGCFRNSDLDPLIWKCLCRRLAPRLVAVWYSPVSHRGSFKEMTGIIAYLTRLCGGNVLENGIMTITSK